MNCGERLDRYQRGFAIDKRGSVTYDEHREDSRIQDSSRKTDVEHDQLDETARKERVLISDCCSSRSGCRETNSPLATHKRSNGHTLSNAKLVETSSSRASEELSDESDEAEEDSVSPGFWLKETKRISASEDIPREVKKGRVAY